MRKDYTSCLVGLQKDQIGSEFQRGYAQHSACPRPLLAKFSAVVVKAFNYMYAPHIHFIAQLRQTTSSCARRGRRPRFGPRSSLIASRNILLSAELSVRSVFDEAAVHFSAPMAASTVVDEDAPAWTRVNSLAFTQSRGGWAPSTFSLLNYDGLNKNAHQQGKSRPTIVQETSKSTSK